MNTGGSPPRNTPGSVSIPSTPIASSSASSTSANPFNSSSSSSPSNSSALQTPLSTPTSATTTMDSLSSGMMTPTPQSNGVAPFEPSSNLTANYTVRKTARSGAGAAPGNYSAPAPSVASTTTNAVSGATSTATANPPPPPPPMLAPSWPALHLTPLNDTFVPKQISLYPPGTRVKIGRQTNAKTVPNSTNGYFDSKVLSRMHAEVWSEDGKVYIKDVKSSNGTFINGNRLSPEAAESDVFELHSDDQVEFGIDIVSDDSKTIVHHKVSARVFLVMNDNDLAVSQRDVNRWYREAGENSLARRAGPKVVNSSTANGLSFEHVLNRLQGELQKSKDTGASLGDVSSTLTDVHDTLGGGVPPPLPPFSRVPPYGTPGAQSNSRDPHAQSIAQLQSQLSETQSALSSHVAKIRDLEAVLKDHETLKREVGALRIQMDEARKDFESLVRTREREGRESPVARLLESGADQDPASSVTTDSHLVSREKDLSDENAALSNRLESLSASLAQATASSDSLKQQHAAASSTIVALEAKVNSLEHAMKSQIDIVAWKDAFERDWNRDRQAWHAEREMLLEKVREWERSASRAASTSSSTYSSPDPSNQRSIVAGGGGTPTAPRRRRNRRRRPSSQSTDSDHGDPADAGASSDDTRTLSTDITSPSSSSSGRSQQQPQQQGNNRHGKLDWRGRGPGDRFGHEGLTWRSDGGGQQHLTQYAGAGAVVMIGVAAAWLLSARMKD